MKNIKLTVLVNCLLLIALPPAIIFSQSQKGSAPAKSKSTKEIKIPKGKPIACDCPKAIPITLEYSAKYGFTCETNGYGQVQEISLKDRSSKYYFEEEHNTAWYLITILTHGEMIFEITPVDQADDYDFLLFKYTDSTFCKNFTTKKHTPLRTNISRSRYENLGKTGLSATAKTECTSAGLGSSYSKSIDVKQGEKYYLLLDNVYPNGSGHSITFSILRNIEIKGTVINDDSIPIKAEVTLEDEQGSIIEKTLSNPKTGEYDFRAKVNQMQKYSLNFYNDSSFMEAKSIIIPTVEKVISFNDIKVILPKLKKGGKYPMKNINFYGNSPEVYPSSLSSLNNLYKLLKKNKKLVIRIEGHVNGQHPNNLSGIVFEQKLSEQRASTVYFF